MKRLVAACLSVLLLIVVPDVCFSSSGGGSVRPTCFMESASPEPGKTCRVKGQFIVQPTDADKISSITVTLSTSSGLSVDRLATSDGYSVKGTTGTITITGSGRNSVFVLVYCNVSENATANESVTFSNVRVTLNRNGRCAGYYRSASRA